MKVWLGIYCYHNLCETWETVEKVLDFPKGYIRKIMNDEVYTNSIPVVLFKNLLVSLHIRFWEIAPAFIPTYKLLKSKETKEDLKKKPYGYMLWENEEALYKYTLHLNELMLPPAPFKPNQSP